MRLHCVAHLRVSSVTVTFSRCKQGQAPFRLATNQKNVFSTAKKNNGRRGVKSAANVGMEAFAALEAKLLAEKKKPSQEATSSMLENVEALDKDTRHVNPSVDGNRENNFPAISSDMVLAEPKPPEPEECCGSGCHNCVFITYWSELERYKKQLKAISEGKLHTIIENSHGGNGPEEQATGNCQGCDCDGESPLIAGTMKPHLYHIIICSGTHTASLEAARIENIKGSFAQKMYKALDKYNLIEKKDKSNGTKQQNLWVKLTACSEGPHSKITATAQTEEQEEGNANFEEETAADVLVYPGGKRYCNLQAADLDQFIEGQLLPAAVTSSSPNPVLGEVRRAPGADPPGSVLPPQNKWAQEPAVGNKDPFFVTSAGEEAREERAPPAPPSGGAAPAPAAAPAEARRLVLVCCHGARDERCGTAGPPIITAMKAFLESQGIPDSEVSVLSSTHIGGHKHAGTLIVYPEGDCYGRIHSENAAKLLQDYILKGRKWKQHWRGNILAPLPTSVYNVN